MNFSARAASLACLCDSLEAYLELHSHCFLLPVFFSPVDAGISVEDAGSTHRSSAVQESEHLKLIEVTRFDQMLLTGRNLEGFRDVSPD